MRSLCNFVLLCSKGREQNHLEDKHLVKDTKQREWGDKKKKKKLSQFSLLSMSGLHIHAWLWCCLSLIGFSVIVNWNLQLSFCFLFRGLKALGVRDLTYRLAFLACSVQATNPRVCHFCYYFCFANCIHIRKPQNTCLKNEDLGLYRLQLCKSLVCSAWKLYLCCK